MKTGIKLITLIIATFFIMPNIFAQTTDEGVGKNTASNKWGKDSAECVKNFSLFREFYRQNNYKDAYEPWQKVFIDCPQSSKNIYINGTVIISYQIRNTKNISRQQQLVDTLMLIYDKRIEYYGEEGFVLGRKALDYIKYVPDFYLARIKNEKDTAKKILINDTLISIWNNAYSMFERSITLEKNAASAPVIDGYFQTTELYFKNNKLEKDIIIDAYDKSSDILDFNIKEISHKLNTAIVDIDTLKKNFENKLIDEAAYKNMMTKLQKDTATFTKTLESYTSVKNNVETRFTPYATCEDLVNIYGKKLKGNEENIEMLTKITRIMNKKKCIDNQIFFTATENLHRLQPTANSAFLMGYMLYKKEENAKAKDFLEEAIKKYEDPLDKANAYLMLVDVCKKLGQYAVARQYAYKYAELIPTSGMPYLLIGDLYAATAASCGDNELTARVAYWAAADKYMKAKSIDKTLEEDATQRINNIRSRFPDTNTLFFYGLTKGQSYSVGCWIGETTTIR